LLLVKKKNVDKPEMVLSLGVAALQNAEKGEQAKLFVIVNDIEHLLCTLEAGRVDQFRIDLSFPDSDDVTFKVEGDGVVSLTGLLHLIDAQSDSESYSTDSYMGAEYPMESDNEIISTEEDDGDPPILAPFGSDDEFDEDEYENNRPNPRVQEIPDEQDKEDNQGN